MIETRSCFLHGDYTGKEACPGCQPSPAAPPARDGEPVTQGEREHLHDLLASALGLVDPETNPELVADIDAVLTPCDEASKCVPYIPRDPRAEQVIELEAEVARLTAENAELRAASSSPREPQKDETLREKVLPGAMRVVEAIKRDLAPDLDENDGGQILVWLRDFGIECAGLKSEPREPHAALIARDREGGHLDG